MYLYFHITVIIATQYIKEPQMKVTKPLAPLPANPLDRIKLTAFDRLRAETAIRRGEYIAELLLEGIDAVRTLFGSVKPRTSPAHRLGPTG